MPHLPVTRPPTTKLNCIVNTVNENISLLKKNIETSQAKLLKN